MPSAQLSGSVLAGFAWLNTKAGLNCRFAWEKGLPGSRDLSRMKGKGNMNTRKQLAVATTPARIATMRRRKTFDFALTVCEFAASVRNGVADQGNWPRN